MTTMPVEMYTDGSCLKNPGVGGYAYIIKYYLETEGDDSSMPQPQVLEKNQGYRLTTNNRMEIMAVLYGIHEVINMIKDGTLAGTAQLNVWSDSEYVVNSISQHWIDRWKEKNWMTAGWNGKPPAPVKNKDLWELITEALSELKDLGTTMRIQHVKGHNGDEFNERADKLAVAASSGTNHVIDEVYEKTTTVYNKR